MPLPGKKANFDFPHTNDDRKHSIYSRKIKIQSLQVYAQDTEISIDYLAISPGRIAFLNTALFKAVSISNLQMIFHSMKEYRSITASHGEWLFPCGHLFLEHGKIVYSDNKIKEFDKCEIDPSSWEIVQSEYQLHLETENSNQEPSIFGIRSILFSARKAR